MGMGTYISGCAAGCASLGPGMVVCTPLCWGLVAVGCAYGASAACAATDPSSFPSFRHPALYRHYRRINE